MHKHDARRTQLWNGFGRTSFPPTENDFLRFSSFFSSSSYIQIQFLSSLVFLVPRQTQSSIWNLLTLNLPESAIPRVSLLSWCAPLVRVRSLFMTVRLCFGWLATPATTTVQAKARLVLCVRGYDLFGISIFAYIEPFSNGSLKKKWLDYVILFIFLY